MTAAEPKWVGLFAGLNERQFRKLVVLVRRRGGGKPTGGRPWALPLEDRILLVAAYWRTNLTMRQLGPRFGISKSAAGRVIDHIAPLLALAPVRRRHPSDTVLIVDSRPGPDPRQERGRFQQELPLFHQPPGRHRRHHTTGRGGRTAHCPATATTPVPTGNRAWTAP